MNLTSMPPVRAALAALFVVNAVVISLPLDSYAADTKEMVPEEEAVQMDTLEVSTTIGNYHETTSSMATKVPTDLKAISGSLQILNFSALSDRNAKTLQDVYTYIVGMAQSQVNVNGFTFRGFTNTGGFTQNIQFDGLMGATTNRGGASNANVESIEFLKGPNSVLYGQMRPGGLMNIITKSPQPTQSATISVSYQTYAGEFDWPGEQNGFIGSIDLTGPIDAKKHLLYRLIVAGQDVHTWRKGVWKRNMYVYPSLMYKWSNDTQLSVKMEALYERQRQDDGLLPIFTNSNWGPSASYVVARYNTVYQEPTDYTNDDGYAIHTSFKTRFNDRWNFRLQNRTAYSREFIRELTNIVSGARATPATPIEATTYVRQYNYTDGPHRYCYFDSNVYGDIGPEKFKNTVVFGLAGGAEATDARRISFGTKVAPISIFHPILGVTPYPADGKSPNNPKQNLTSFGAYAFDMMNIAQRWHVSVGTRYDQQQAHTFDPINPVTSPYLHQLVHAVTSQGGVVYDITKQLSGYACVSQSFTPNSVTTVDENGNAGFPVEKGLQYEGGLKFESSDHNFYASLAAYLIKRQNVAVSTGLTLPVSKLAIFRLDGEQRSKGIEFESQWRPLLHWQFQAGLALNKAYIAKSIKNPKQVGEDLVNAPRVSANFWTRYNVPTGPMKGLGFGLGIIHVGKQWAVLNTTTGAFRIPSWTRADGNIYYKWRKYELTLNCMNLLDTRYIQIARAQEVLVPGDERRITLSATTHF